MLNTNVNFNEQTQRVPSWWRSVLWSYLQSYFCSQQGAGCCFFLTWSVLVVLHVCQDPGCWYQEACRHDGKRNDLLLPAGDETEELVGWLCDGHIVCGVSGTVAHWCCVLMQRIKRTCPCSLLFPALQLSDEQTLGLWEEDLGKHSSFHQLWTKLVAL